LDAADSVSFGDTRSRKPGGEQANVGLAL